MIEESLLKTCPKCGEGISLNAGEPPGWDFDLDMCEYCAEEVLAAEEDADREMGIDSY